MPRPTISAASPAPRPAPPWWIAIAVPTSTGATEAARVAGRTADHQTSAALGRVSAAVAIGLGALGELREVRLSLLHVRVAAYLRLFAHVVEERRVAGQLLDARQPVVRGVHACLDHAQRERAELEHLAAPRDRLLLQVGDRHDLVHEPHRQRLLRVVLLAQEPDLACLLLADDAGEQPGAVAAVEAADPRPGLAEARVVGRDREVAHDVKDVAAPDRVAGDHRDDRLGQAADLDLEIEDIEPAPAARVDVAVLAPHALIAARAER